MKKFSWIFALILALSIGFIGCPEPEPEKKGSTTTTDDPPYEYNAAAEEIAVQFSAGSIVNTTKNGDNPGTITYPSATSYNYVITAGADYQKSVLRFKITLPDGVTLADYSKVTFKWKADGKTVTTPLSPEQADLNGKFQQDINSNKKLLLMATNSPANFASDTSWSNELPLYQNIISTDFFETYPDARIWDAPATKELAASPPATNTDGTPFKYPLPSKGWAPNTNGIEEHAVEIPILPKFTEALEGEIWVSIYVHSNEGSYTVSDVKFIPGAVDATVNNTEAGENAPVYVKPEPVGVAKAINLTVDLASVLQGATVNSGSATVTANETAGVDAEFGANSNNNRLVFVLTPAQVATINSRVNSKINVVLTGTKTDGADTADAFRFYLGDATMGGNWNATGSPDTAKIATFGGEGKTFAFEANADKTNDNASGVPAYSDRPIHFIIRKSADGAATINVTAVTITVYVDDVTPAVPASFLEATGIQKVLVSDPEPYGTYGSGPHEIAHSVIKVNGNGGFWVQLPAGIASSDTVTITYAAYLTEGTEAKFIQKTGSGWTDTDPAGYPSLTTTGAVSTLDVVVAGLEDGATKAYFQTNGSFEVKFKIISVLKK